MTTIYEKHEKAFNLIRAGALVVNGQQVGKLSFKYPVRGEGRVTCFLHLHGYAMVSGTASGYGYDKTTAAFEAACKKLDTVCLEKYPQLENVDCEGDSFDSFLRKNNIQYFGAV